MGGFLDIYLNTTVQCPYQYVLVNQSKDSGCYLSCGTLGFARP